MGFALSLVLIYVINVQSFGWTIQFHVPWLFLVQSSVVVIVGTALAGFFPARASRPSGHGARRMTRRDLAAAFVLGAALVAGALVTPVAQAPGHRPQCRTTPAWRDAMPGYLFRFPADHASHPDYQIEWWYYTGNVDAADGRRFGYQVTFFRVGVDPLADQPVALGRS